MMRAAARRVKAALRDQLEAQSPGDRGSLDQLDAHRIAEPVSLAGIAPRHGVMALIETEIFVADGASGDESVGAGIAQAHEQPGAMDAGDAALEGGAEPVGEE